MRTSDKAADALHRLKPTEKTAIAALFLSRLFSVRASRIQARARRLCRKAAEGNDARRHCRTKAWCCRGTTPESCVSGKGRPDRQSGPSAFFTGVNRHLYSKSSQPRAEASIALPRRSSPASGSSWRKQAPSISVTSSRSKRTSTAPCPCKGGSAKD